jgi:hypothetical protein
MQIFKECAQKMPLPAIGKALLLNYCSYICVENLTFENSQSFMDI